MVIISDQRMPKMQGTELLQKSIELHPEAVRILLTGYTDIESVIEAVNQSEIYRYLTKPWEPTDLLLTVQQAIEKYELSHELKNKNKELKKALDELRVLDTAKSEFMYLINHELKTPLTVLSSYLQILMETKLDSEQKNYLDKINNSVHKLNALIEDVLELVSAETGHKKINLRKTSLDKILSGIETDFLDQAKAKNIKININYDRAFLKVDSDIVKSILKRLIDNAIKFGDKSSEVNISALQQDTSTVFKITNTGPHLDTKKIEKILKPFSLDEDFMNHTKGFGLGLSISQALLQTHNSHLEISSKKNQFLVQFEFSEIPESNKN